VSTYLKYETLRTVRNKQVFFFSLVLPVVLYLAIGGPQKNNNHFGGVPGLNGAQYYMVSLLSYGAMAGLLSVGGRIAVERSLGWNRQLRITPLSPRTYFGSKIGVGYMFAVLTMVAMYVLGMMFGVRMPAERWVVMSVLILLALIPFAGLGIAMGHLISADAVGPALGIGTFALGLLGGTWFPINGDSLLAKVCKLLPSWWLVQAGHVAYGGSLNPWGVEGWIVVGFWSVALAVFAVWAFRRDTARG
jgi:ABC-2 type transport system permease protein